MIFLVLTIVAFSVILLSKHVFKKWFNHVAVYILIWYTMLYLYELRLLPYYDLSPLTWFTISSAFFSFCIGSFIVYLVRKNFSINNSSQIFTANKLVLFSDDGKALKYSILIISILGLALALLIWQVLIDKYGSISGVFLNALTIYRSRIAESGIEGVIPYTGFLSFSGVFLSGVYVAYKRKVGLISLLPFIAVILNQIAVFGRAGILFAFFLFIAVFSLSRHYFSGNSLIEKRRNKLSVIITLVIVVSLAVASAGLIRSFRHTVESYGASSQTLEDLRGGFFITPSLYLYASSHVGVLNAYLQNDFDEDKMLGETTFQPFYNFLSKLEWVEHPTFYEKGYLIPMWTNTGTYLRDLFGDFGVAGILVIPFLLGLITSIFWFKFFEEGKMWQLLILTFLFVVIMFSFLVIYSKFANFLLSFCFLALLIPFLEKLVLRYSK